MSMLELRRVSKAYGQGAAKVHALRDVSLDVEAGTMVAVMGPSGSGKSTLLTIAGSLEEPSSGVSPPWSCRTTLTSPRAGTGNGGFPARRTVFRWGWRLFGREWRQQLLVLGLLTAAVAATIWGTSVVTNVQLSDPSYAVFGTAAALVTLPGNDPHLAADIAAVQASWGPTDVIENQNIATGTSQPVQLRAESPHGHYNAPLLGLVSGAYPAGPGQVALTSPRVGFCPAVECASRRDVTVPRSNGTACCRRVSRLAGRSWCDGTG